ncbi:protein ANTAGONIST OF LIKE HETEROCHROMATIN PROTEIN 1-like [Impatiens glandulifera]|uniref:protein ANTAGONIST OF LIKE HETEROCHROMATIN PROTEIN 1-like n=1 Tax=Impatiens glandulifera TaxID=253017 RepID=UPI001FB099A9|nr:protein ANTAGONIST OF LIKE HETEROCHROMATIN PROTEIN 1-like [Impatiens glandulifera]
MEVSAFSFLNQEDYNNNNMVDQDINNNGNNPIMKTTTDFDTESSDKAAPSFDEILATFTHNNWAVDTGFDSFTNQIPQPINDYVDNSHGSSSFSDFKDNKNNKRSRKETPESSSGQHQQQRRLWVKNRSNAWWEQCNSPDFPEDEFRKAFRMSKSTFELICNELDSAVTKKNTMLRLAIPVRQRVAVCIWRLATGEPLRLVSKRFGLGISTCHKLVLEVCSAIKTVLMPKFLQWPDENKLNEIRSEFESISGIPNVCGSIYTTHIPIIAPKISVAAYFNKRHTERNQKTSYSITVQGLVDPKGVFSDVCIGWPGSMPDDKILEKSALLQRANNGALKDQWVVGNSSYPLMDWLLVPYGHQNITWTQHAFNDKIAKVQEVAKEAFGRLKGRWSCLQKRTEVKLMDLPVVLGACCVLHNICEMRGETMEPELKVELFDDEMSPENPVRSASSMQARDQFAHNLLHRNHAASHDLYFVGQ